MSVVSLINFNHLTLFGFLTLPFVYFGYHAKFWYATERLKLFDFCFGAGSILLAMLVTVKLFDAARAGDREQVVNCLLHFFPLALTFIILKRSKKSTTAATAEKKEGSNESGFSPKARNADIENVTWDDIIINQETKSELISVIDLLKNPEAAKEYGIAVPKGMLFYGPPGTGKTTIAKAVANMAGLSFFVLKANEIVSKWVGESEKNLTQLFDAAKAQSPAVIFVDEIDSLGKRRSDSSASHSDNLLNHLLQLIDGVIKTEGIYVIGATNRLELVDEALTRGGRLERAIEIPRPDFESRYKLFSLFMGKMKLGPDVDLDLLARVTDGNSGADIKAICNQAGLHAYRREQKLPQGERVHQVKSEDIEAALEMFTVDESEIEKFGKDGDSDEPKPLNSQIEKISWNDLVIQEEVQQELQSVITLLKDPETAKRYGINIPRGILLNGPPGTGKTTLAKVIANEAKLSFFVLKADEVISKWVGDSEKNLTRLFKAAVKHAPSVIFIDEVDSIGKNRAEGNAQHADNLLNHLLQMIDGVITREGIYVVAATNRADLVDPALKRAGRLNKTIEIPLPDMAARMKLFELYLSKLPIKKKVDLEWLANVTSNKSAADIKEICNQAGLNAFKRESARGLRAYEIESSDLEKAVAEWVNR